MAAITLGGEPMGLWEPEQYSTPGGTALHVGPAGWSYDDWSGIVYPDPKPRGFRPPQFLAEFFNTIELNNTFYRPPKPGYCHRWIKDVEGRPDFLYTAKLWKRFTHERDEHWTGQDVEVFRTGIGPLVEAGKLGALLVQFPWSFRYNRRSKDYLRELVDEFGDLPLVLEVRSKAWVQEKALDFIRSLQVGFCNIDQPAYRSNVPLTAYGFGPVGYLRLHGRNYDAWFAEDAGRDERYDYLYSGEELDEIQKALDEIARQVERMFVIANNHYRGQAVATGIQLIRRLTGDDIQPPGRVGELYGIR
ncbi:MAG: DUF72 domain-containing protein [Candidatus Brocadiaceae bacterium]|jgi:uncharacterized protein YecE (DUF72 family)